MGSTVVRYMLSKLKEREDKKKKEKKEEKKDPYSKMLQPPKRIRKQKKYYA